MRLLVKKGSCLRWFSISSIPSSLLEFLYEELLLAESQHSALSEDYHWIIFLVRKSCRCIASRIHRKQESKKVSCQCQSYQHFLQTRKILVMMMSKQNWKKEAHTWKYSPPWFTVRFTSSIYILSWNLAEKMTTSKVLGVTAQPPGSILEAKPLRQGQKTRTLGQQSKSSFHL